MGNETVIDYRQVWLDSEELIRDLEQKLKVITESLLASEKALAVMTKEKEDYRKRLNRESL